MAFLGNVRVWSHPAPSRQEKEAVILRWGSRQLSVGALE